MKTINDTIEKLKSEISHRKQKINIISGNSEMYQLRIPEFNIGAIKREIDILEEVIKDLESIKILNHNSRENLHDTIICFINGKFQDIEIDNETTQGRLSAKQDKVLAERIRGMYKKQNQIKDFETYMKMLESYNEFLYNMTNLFRVRRS